MSKWFKRTIPPEDMKEILFADHPVWNAGGSKIDRKLEYLSNLIELLNTLNSHEDHKATGKRIERTADSIEKELGIVSPMTDGKFSVPDFAIQVSPQEAQIVANALRDRLAKVVVAGGDQEADHEYRGKIVGLVETFQKYSGNKIKSPRV